MTRARWWCPEAVARRLRGRKIGEASKPIEEREAEMSEPTKFEIFTDYV